MTRNLPTPTCSAEVRRPVEPALDGARVSPIRRRVLAAALVLLVSSVVGGAQPAGATHYNGASLRWQFDLSYANPGYARVLLTFESSWRWSTNWTSPVYPGVGTVATNADWAMSVSDKNGTSLSNFNVPLTVLSVDSAGDLFLGSGTVTLDYPTSAFPISVRHSGCCRLSTLSEGNHDQSWFVSTVIPLPGIGTPTRSPYLTVPFPQRVHLPANTAASILLPIQMTGSLVKVLSFAPQATSGLLQTRPIGVAACSPNGCTQCNADYTGVCASGMTISPQGVLEWTPTLPGLYSVQLAVTGVDIGTSMPKVAIPLDMIFSVDASPCTGCPSADPVVVQPAYSVVVGTPLAIPVTASASESAVILLNSPLPAGATLSTTYGSSPLASTLSWTPETLDVGTHEVCFQAITNTGYLSPSLRCTTITVTSSTPCAAGTFSATGSSPCTACPNGSFNTVPGATSCSPCTAGCDDGEYQATACTTTSDATCAACDPSCVTCSGPTAGDCTARPLCQPGFVSANGQQPCTPCAAGSYASAPGQLACSPCAAGTFAEAAGLATCEPCATGCATGEYAATACSATSDLACGACDAGCATCSGPSASECTSCANLELPVGGACLPGCSATPADGCRLPAVSGKAKLDVKDKDDDAKDQLKWTWSKGNATVISDFGDPLATSDYFLCVYDGSSRVSSTTLPAGGTCDGKPCWSKVKTGFTYKNKLLMPDGGASAKLTAGATGKATVTVLAKGVALETPDPRAFTGPIRVQLQSSGGGACFESVFSAPFKKNKDGVFSDLAD